MKCPPHTGRGVAGEMILSAGIILVRKEGGDWKFLFLRAYKNWDFPKGIVERVYKETSPYYSGGKKVARYYIAETSQPEVVFSVNPEIGKPEHHEYRWVSYEELKELAPSRLKAIVEWAHHIVHRET
ncbi:MAG: NUDIX hydrolase [Deltaproteobacteria bacterium]|nr:NUDIX hydrolase [Deltaproteobacteria bacterium]